MWPVYKGTFERQFGLRPGWGYTRDHEIPAKDLGRSFDYLDRRPDIDQGRLAYFGLSWGAPPRKYLSGRGGSLPGYSFGLCGHGLGDRLPPLT